MIKTDGISFMKSVLIWKISTVFESPGFMSFFPLKQGLYGKQVSDEKIIYGLINGVKGVIRPVIAMIRCKVPLNVKPLSALAAASWF